MFTLNQQVNLGQAFNSLFCEPKINSALDSNTIDQKLSKAKPYEKLYLSTEFLGKSRSTMTLFDLDGKVSANIKGINVGIGGGVRAQSNFEVDSVMYQIDFFHVRAEERIYGKDMRLKLASEHIQSLKDKKFGTFYQQYGDSFISAIGWGSKLSLIVKWNTNDKKTQKRIRGEMEVGQAAIAKGQFLANLVSTMQENQTYLKVSLESEGIGIAGSEILDFSKIHHVEDLISKIKSLTKPKTKNDKGIQLYVIKHDYSDIVDEDMSDFLGTIHTAEEIVDKISNCNKFSSTLDLELSKGRLPYTDEKGILAENENRLIDLWSTIKKAHYNSLSKKIDLWQEILQKVFVDLNSVCETVNITNPPLLHPKILELKGKFSNDERKGAIEVDVTRVVPKDISQLSLTNVNQLDVIQSVIAFERAERKYLYMFLRAKDLNPTFGEFEKKQKRWFVKLPQMQKEADHHKMIIKVHIEHEKEDGLKIDKNSKLMIYGFRQLIDSHKRPRVEKDEDDIEKQPTKMAKLSP